MYNKYFGTQDESIPRVQKEEKSIGIGAEAMRNARGDPTEQGRERGKKTSQKTHAITEKAEIKHQDCLI
ncbi:unnamed protein product [Allacma fusca]|uniref:Uncharacterized protein n=1 Tax=Allacma fusca TaxID=39272 RepID=A0A8J2KY75_9HEXA|nr:unnamed protein product [Allacma fusca]